MAEATGTPEHLFPDELIDEPTWSDDRLGGLSTRIIDAPFITIGGGLGSFAMVQALRISGVSPRDITVLGTADRPHDSFKRLAEASQLTSEDILRSASDATIDNIWGFPGYAVRQAIRTHGVRPLWTVLTEPILSEYFNPTLRQVCSSVEAEAERLGWSDMLAKGRARLIRRRAEGGYFVVQTQESRQSRSVSAIYRCRYGHVAIGYPSPRYLPQVEDFRRRSADGTRVVNAYGAHEHVYERLRHAGGDVILRGAGITASRVLQRLFDDREAGVTGARVAHVFRTFVDGPAGPRRFRRDGGDGFSYQPFNFPKAAFGGQLKQALEQRNPAARSELLKAMGGTSTARRGLWRNQIKEGLGGGWYRQLTGDIIGIEQGPDGALDVKIQGRNGALVRLRADFMIDATGLEDRIRVHGLVADLVDTVGARLNAVGRLDVEPTFELRSLRQEPGRVYASGAVTYGGQYGPVDSFLGLQYAALAICDDLARLGFCGRIGVRDSVRQWWRWMRHRTP
jgi:hypothetical protein